MSKSEGGTTGGVASNEHRSGGEDPERSHRRASSSEWKQYYERADRVRDRLGDPFQKLVERAEARRRLSDAVSRLAIVVMVLTLLGLAMWLLLDLSHDPHFNRRVHEVPSGRSDRDVTMSVSSLAVCIERRA